MIDLRSDTVTVPCADMRAAMVAAPVGDDQYGEDPSVNALQAEVASLLGTADALFVPSGVMANQIALRSLTSPGDTVLVPPDSHIATLEAGAGARNASVQFMPAGSRGAFAVGDVELCRFSPGSALGAAITLVVVENSHTMSGGRVFPLCDLRELVEYASDAGIATYIDGARLFNAAVALGESARELTSGCDLVSISLSKGLGCPVGAVLAGSSELISRARLHRRVLGGAMRQSGMLAAAGLFALRHNVQQIAIDHANARLFAETLQTDSRVILDIADPQTNIVLFEVPSAHDLVSNCAARGVKLSALSASLVRAVTHRDVTTRDCASAAEVVLESLSPP